MLNKTKLELVAKNAITKRLSFRSINDIRGFRQSSSRSLKRLKAFLRAEILRRLSLDTYENKIKHLATNTVAIHMLKEIKILRNICNEQLKKFIYLNCPQNIFSWSHEDWPDTLPYRLMWYNLLKRRMPSQIFNMWLTSKKIKAFENAFKTIYRAYTSRTETAMEAMKPFLKFKDTKEYIAAELKENAKLNNDAKLKLANVGYLRKGWTSLNPLAENTLWIARAELKYMLDYSKIKEDEVTYRNQLAEKRLTEEIHNYNKRISNEDVVSSSTRDAYFHEIAVLRERIEKMSQRYDLECSRLDSDISYFRAAIEKLQINRMFHLENIERFKQTKNSIAKESLAGSFRKKSVKRISRASKESAGK